VCTISLKQAEYWKYALRSISTKGLPEKSGLVQHSCEEGHKIFWKEAKVLQTEPNTTYRKYEYKECAYIYVVDYPHQSTQLLPLSHLNSHYHSEVRN
jgi:hypothetical protein